MIADKTLDQALVELMRTKLALEALRAERKAQYTYCFRQSCEAAKAGTHFASTGTHCPVCGERAGRHNPGPKLHAAAKRATLDLTRKLADLRAGR